MEKTNGENQDQPPRQIEDKTQTAAPDNVLQIELAKKVNEALDELPDKQRSAILLCRQEELSYEQIARILGCSLSATKSLIHRGREALREKLKPYLKSGDW